MHDSSGPRWPTTLSAPSRQAAAERCAVLVLHGVTDAHRVGEGDVRKLPALSAAHHGEVVEVGPPVLRNEVVGDGARDMVPAARRVRRVARQVGAGSRNSRVTEFPLPESASAWPAA